MMWQPVTKNHSFHMRFCLHRPGLTIGYKRFPLPFPFISLLISSFVDFFFLILGHLLINFWRILVFFHQTPFQISEIVWRHVAIQQLVLPQQPCNTLDESFSIFFSFVFNNFLLQPFLAQWRLSFFHYFNHWFQ